MCILIVFVPEVVIPLKLKLDVSGLAHVPLMFIVTGLVSVEWFVEMSEIQAERLVKSPPAPDLIV